MKTTIDDYVSTYTEEKMPPPWQTYTVQNRPGQGNLHIIQKVFEGPFEFDIFYTPSSSTTSKPSSEDLTEQIDTVVNDFKSRYTALLPPQPPFTAAKYLPFAHSLFANLIGGLGYFHGDQLIDRSANPAYDELDEGFHHETLAARQQAQAQLEGPYTLFTSVPSRPFFPRGFLWDEGFHLLPMVEWDGEVVMRVLSSWFGVMDEEGWIAREMILGAEARSKVPEEFRVQYPHYANPPTLFMVLEDLLDVYEQPREEYTADGQQPLDGLASPDIELFTSWLSALYPLLKRNFEWYRRTQWGDLKSYDRPAFSSKEAYRWRGRTERHILTSGLDDYPRAQPPHPGELHVDLISWMGMAARSLSRVAGFVGEKEDAEKYGKVAEAIRRNVDDLHWSKEEKTYCDASVDVDYEESVLVCHKGFVSRFSLQPFFRTHC